MRKITIGDVAIRAKVSKSTVSQYLNKRYEYMGAETKRRIQIAIKDLNFQPNFVARSLKKKSTSTIGVIVANILHSISTQVTRGIEDVCNENDFHVILCNADDKPDKEKRYIEMLQAKQVDGIIVFPTGGNLSLYNEMNLENYPLVFVDRVVQSISTDTVMLDNKSAVKLAVEHFLEKGYEQIAFITTSLELNITPRFERINEFRRLLESNSLPIIESYIKSLDIKDIQNGLKAMFALKQPPRALLVGNDLVLMEVLKFVQEYHINIPNDLALITFDDVTYNSIYRPPLTAIEQPAEEMGKKAATLLLDKIKKKEEKNEDQIHHFQPRLIERNSC